MSYPANLRGWGPGWPVDRSADQRWVTARRSGVRFQVHHVIAPIVQFLIDEVERRDYLLHVEGDVPDDWGFNSRPIRGTTTPSSHSWGLAIDIDATKFPMGQSRNRPPQWIVDLFEAYGFEWGGRWRRPDPMHFEFAGSITEARHIVAMLAASHLAQEPPAMPGSAPQVEPPPDPEPEPTGRKPMWLVRIRPQDARNDFERDAVWVTDGLTARRWIPKRDPHLQTQTLLQHAANLPTEVIPVSRVWLEQFPWLNKDQDPRR